MRSKIDVKVKKLNEDAVIPTYGSADAAGFDLYAAEDTVILPGETEKVKLGFALAIPSGYEMQVRPRSGTSVKTKLRLPNSPGTIDADYRGEVAIILTNDHAAGPKKREILLIDGNRITCNEEFPEGTYVIRKHDRLAQGVLQEVPFANFAEVEELEATERGKRGFGSTGSR